MREGVAALLLRLGLGGTLVWLGLDVLLNASPVTRIASRFGVLTGMFGMTAPQIAESLGWLHIVLGIGLILGIFVRLVAVLVVLLTLLAIARMGVFDLAKSKDFGIIGGALWLMLTGSTLLSIDSFLANVRTLVWLAPDLPAGRLANMFLGIGLGAVFLLNGALTFFQIGTLAGMLQNDPLLALLRQQFTPMLIAQVLGGVQIVLGLLLVLGWIRVVAGTLAALLIAVFMARLGMLDSMLLKDPALLSVALAIATLGLPSSTGRHNIGRSMRSRRASSR